MLPLPLYGFNSSQMVVTRVMQWVFMKWVQDINDVLYRVSPLDLFVYTAHAISTVRMHCSLIAVRMYVFTYCMCDNQKNKYMYSYYIMAPFMIEALTTSLLALHLCLCVCVSVSLAPCLCLLLQEAHVHL